MHNPLEPFLRDFGIVVLDGGLATELERRGANLNDPLWSARLLIENPALIREVHYDYFRAGADLATSASYQATFPGFAARGLNETRAADLMRLSVRLAREARDQFWTERHDRRLRPLVAASIGCYGAYLHDGAEYRGDYGLSLQQLMDFHRPRLATLTESGADLLACETIPCQLEAEALVRLLQEFPSVPAWLSFSCRDERSVWHGETLVDCVQAATSTAQVVAVAINCTAPRHITGLLTNLSGFTQKPILVYPNSGEAWDARAHAWGETRYAFDWREGVRRWMDLGARGIGGCCRTTPDTIRLIRESIQRASD